MPKLGGVISDLRCPTGDHFGHSERMDGLSIFPRYKWHSIPVQLESVRKLLDYDFVNVYPGHGRRVEYESTEERDAQILAFLAEQN